MNLTVTELNTLLTGVPFYPVNVTRGRKFRGFGYVVSSYVADNGGFANSGVRPLMYHNVYKVWDPAKNAYDYFNGGSSKRGGGYSERPLECEDGVTEPDVPDTTRVPALLEYLEGIVSACKARCGTDLKWRRNYLRKVLGASAAAAEVLCVK